ncbi:cytochrome P450 oxidoreductase [Stachybotrys elegans]|uniref:Cytochrome P450 oxidoreductase n=1 Tax=Stachybotrys elegans TaxID=80388 RepID=A0A8K0S9D0_9HYPO|nr:cytochrome P450 oxidoreductase [Stachybotrys elegans]
MPDFPSQISAFLLGRSIYRISPLHRLHGIPGPFLPRFSSAWLNYHAFIGDESTAVHALHEQYGPIVRTGPNSVDIADGSVLNTVYLDKGGFAKPEFYHNFDIDGHVTLFSSTHSAYRGPRAKAVLPLFSTGNIRSDATHLLEAAARSFTKRLDREVGRHRASGDPLNILPLARGFALDAVSSYLFDYNYGACEEDQNDSGHGSAFGMVDAFVAVGQSWYLSSWLFKLYEWTLSALLPDVQATQSIRHVDDFLELVVAHAKKNEGSSSFPSRLLRAGYSESEVAAQCKDLIFAGTDSTAMNLATICFMLVKFPHKYELLRQELLSSNPSDEDLQSLPYLQGVIKEGLRLSMANPSRLPRVVPATGLRYGGFVVPKNTIVSCTPYELHLDPAVFADPLAFTPERWLPENNPTDAMRQNFIPFGHGIRQCIARNLATAELFKALSVLVMEDKLRGWRNVEDAIPIKQWFNSHVVGDKIELQVI